VPADISLKVSMSNFRKTSGHSATNTVRKTLTVLGCRFFLFSFIFPFYYAHWISPLSPLGGGDWSTYYWSYKLDEHHVNALSQSYVSQSWFSDYWLSDYEFVFDIQSVLIPMFAVQLLTLVLGLVSIRFNRRNLLLPPFLFSLVVAALMTYAGEKISGDTLAISTEYQVGYYLVYPAIATFLFAFLLNEVSARATVKDKMAD
jgi:hypothetical protein